MRIYRLQCSHCPVKSTRTHIILEIFMTTGALFMKEFGDFYIFAISVKVHLLETHAHISLLLALKAMNTYNKDLLIIERYRNYMIIVL